MSAVEYDIDIQNPNQLLSRGEVRCQDICLSTTYKLLNKINNIFLDVSVYVWER